jgi:polar amino acid transport system substrate-binding protein
MLLMTILLDADDISDAGRFDTTVLRTNNPYYPPQSRGIVTEEGEMLMQGLIRWLLLISLPISILALAACGDDDESTNGGTSPTATEAGGNGVSGEIDISGVRELEDGTLNIGSDIAYAPIEFYKEGTETPDGLDIDLANAMAEALGVDTEFINTGFDGIIEALNTEDYDVIFSAMTINPEREEQIDFVPYVNVGTGILVPVDNPEGIAGIEDLCGLTVAVQLGTVQETYLQTQNETCTEQIEIVTFDTNPLAVEDVRTGGSDANLADFPVTYVDAQESDGDLEALDVQIDPSPYGIGVRKSSTELKAVLEQALDAIIESGEYDEIIEKWSPVAGSIER